MKKLLVLLLASVLLVSCSSASEDASSGAESIEEDIFAGAYHEKNAHDHIDCRIPFDRSAFRSQYLQTGRAAEET